MREADRSRGRSRREVDVGGQAWGSDAVADLLAAAGFEFVAFTPGSSFRGLEESLVNYRGGDPRIVETPHEALSVAIAHGHAKATGNPAACVLHDIVGTLHGSMMLFNAYCDRVPLLALAGAGPVRTGGRRPYFDWLHATRDQSLLVRGYVKWVDQPAAIDGLPESLARGLRYARTPPAGPVYIALDHELQEAELEAPVRPPDFDALGPATPPAPDPTAVEAAARRLVEADLPVILADTVGDDRQAVEALVELAEALGAPVLHGHRVGTPHRYNFPNTHPLDLAGTDVIEEADVLLALGVFSVDHALAEVDGATYERTRLARDDLAVIDVGLRDARVSGLAGDVFRQTETELAIAADTALAVPQLRDAVDRRLADEPAARERCANRAAALGDRHDARRSAWAAEAEDAWDETPVSLPRLAAEVWSVIREAPWVLVNGTLRGWAYRLWEVDAFDRYVGSYSGGGGIGQGIGQAIGAALAYEATDRIPVNLQPDGDLMFYPGGLWTMANLDLPLLTVVHNNRALYNSTAHRQTLAAHRGRDASEAAALVGTGLVEPTPDYAAMAESMGVAGYGPVEDPGDLPDALDAAYRTVRNGRPALVDVVCQPR